MADQFFITIPSNTHENNTASDVRIVLPQTIRLEGEWQVSSYECLPGEFLKI